MISGIWIRLLLERNNEQIIIRNKRSLQVHDSRGYHSERNSKETAENSRKFPAVFCNTGNKNVFLIE